MRALKPLLGLLALTFLSRCTEREPAPAKLAVSYPIAGQTVDVGRHHNLALSPWNLADVDGNKLLSQVVNTGADTIKFEAAWLYLNRYRKITYQQWRGLTYATVCLTDGSWRGEAANNIARGFLNTYNYVVIPSGRYEINAECVVPRGGITGSSSFWSPGNGQGHGFYATEIVMRDDIWWPAGPGAERRMLTTPNSDGSAGNFSYNESMTVEKMYLHGPDKKGDGITRIGMFLSWMGECTYVNQVRADYWTHGMVARGGVPLTIGTASTFWNHTGGLSLLGCAQATFSIQTLSGDGNGRLLNLAAGYGSPAGGIVNVGLLKNEDGTTPGAAVSNQVAVYAEGQYVVNIGIATLACQNGANPEAMFVLNPTLPSYGTQASTLRVGGVYHFGFSTVIKNRVTGSTWSAPQYSGFEFVHYAKWDKVVSGCDDLVKNGGTGGGTTPPPPTTGQPYPRTSWKATAYKTSGEVATAPEHAIDQMAGRHWTNGENQRADRTQRFVLQMEKAQKIGRIVLDVLPLRQTDYPRGLFVEVSTNGTSWTATPATLSGTTKCTVTLTNAPTASWVRLSPNVAVGHWWSIDELNIYP